MFCPLRGDYPFIGSIQGISDLYLWSEISIIEFNIQHFRRLESCDSDSDFIPHRENFAFAVGRSLQFSIGELLGSFGGESRSIGFVSELLQQIGTALGNQGAWRGTTVAATDELYYMGHRPILMTVDVRSHAILKIEIVSDLGSSCWHQHVESLQTSGIQFLKIISDEGNVMAGGRALLSQSVAWQMDTFHAVSGRFGIFKSRLSKQLQSLQATLADREKWFWSTKSDKIRSQSLEQWEKAWNERQEILERQSLFLFLYGGILKQFTLFRSSDAGLRERASAEAEVQAGIELLKTLPLSGLNAELETLEKRLPDLFNFLDFAQTHLKTFEDSIDPIAVPYWKRAWQASKIASKIKKNYLHQGIFKEYAQSDLLLLQEYYGEKESFEALKIEVLGQLDTICSQASSPVETANSFIRPFINQSRDQIQQHTLNLRMFYYNHRILKRGKHKGFPPGNC